jgi:hypothetical protein
MPPVNAVEGTLIFQVKLGFEIQLKPEQRKSIINLLHGEDAGCRDSSYGIRKSLILQLYILNISANQSLLEQGSNISYSCLVICSL